MAFYIRKAFSFGPLRLNLSRSGLGLSVGVKGARLGVGPKGSYVHLGREGLYYRKRLGAPGTPMATLNPPLVPAPSPVTGHFQPIDSGPIAQMVDSTAADLITELNRVRQRSDISPIVLGLGIIALVGALIGQLYWTSLIILIVVIPVAVAARHFDVTKGTAILNYVFEPDIESSFNELKSGFQQLAECSAVWHIPAGGYTEDWKRNAGVCSLVQRTLIHPSFSLPKHVQCNVQVPTLKAGREILYLFPDRILVYSSSGIGAVPYSALTATAGHTRFVEDGRVPSDGKTIGSTWQYVNKHGSPDRRFTHNRQLPIMFYGVLHLMSSSGLNSGLVPIFETNG
jgi:Protein of unknown function (DUF4236)